MHQESVTVANIHQAQQIRYAEFPWLLGRRIIRHFVSCQETSADLLGSTVQLGLAGTLL